MFFTKSDEAVAQLRQPHTVDRGLWEQVSTAVLLLSCNCNQICCQCLSSQQMLTFFYSPHLDNLFKDEALGNNGQICLGLYG